jgi:hypothetical protein
MTCEIFTFPAPGTSRVRVRRQMRAAIVQAKPELSVTAANGRVRKERNEAWREAEAATSYWRARLDFERAVSWVQRLDLPEGSFHPAVDDGADRSLVGKWRQAIVNQLLTPAPDIRSVTWKRAKFSGGDFPYLPVKPERVERAIADDLAFLAAHPTRRSNSEAMARSREFKEAMRQRIREVAASRDLSDEEIKPVLKLKHHEIAKFTEKHGVNLDWLLEGTGRMFKKDAPIRLSPNTGPATA